MSQTSPEQPASKTICVLPWIHVSTTTDGTLQVCCKSEPEKNFIRRDDGESFKVFDVEDYDEFWNSSYLKNIRKEMLAGKEPEICKACYDTERGGAESQRQSKNIQFEKLLNELAPQTETDGTAPVRPALFDLRISNVCNLKCRMCNPYASNQWIEDWNNLFNHSLDKNGESQRLKKLNWYEKKSFWTTVEKYAPYIEHIFFAGGEPTLIQQQYQLLEALIETGAAEKITLSYNTNATQMPDRLLKLWQKFHSIKIYCSVDAYGELNDYIRYPSKWNIIDQNLKKLDQALPSLNNSEATICTTVQAYNITRLDELFTYMIENFDNILRFPYMETLVTPEALDMRVLPMEVKELAAEKLQKYRDRYKDVWETKDLWFVDDQYSTDNNYHKYLMSNWSSRIDQMIKFMMSADHAQHLSRFKETCAYFDRTRDQNILNVLPELAPIFTQKKGAVSSAL